MKLWDYKKYFSMLGGLLLGALIALFLASLLFNKGTDRKDNSENIALESFHDAVQKASPSVVNIYSNVIVKDLDSPFPFSDRFNSIFGLNRSRIESSLGSGVIFYSNGYIVTNQHVIGDKSAGITVELSNGLKKEAKIIGIDKGTDLAVLKIDNDHELSSIEIANSDKLRIGDIVLAIGNPYNFGQTVTQGIVSATSRKRRGISFFDDFIQTDADINQGHSGGALINVYGELIGINTAIISKSGGSEGIGLATPINQALNVMDEIIKNGKVVRGWLGIEAQSLSGKLRSYEDTSGSNGVLITATIRNGPAENAGIIPGDVIHSVNGERTDSPGKIIDMITKLRPGEKVKIKILRGWDEQELTATILERPAIKFLR